MDDIEVYTGSALGMKIHFQNDDMMETMLTLEGESINPSAYLTTQMRMLTKDYTVKDRTMHLYTASPSNFQCISQMLSSDEFKTTLDTFLKSQKMNALIDHVLPDIDDVEIVDGFIRRFNIIFFLKEALPFVDESKIKKYIISQHEKSLSYTDSSLKLDMKFKNGKIFAETTIHFEGNFHVTDIDYIQSLKKTNYKINFKPNLLILKGWTFIEQEDILNG